MSDHKIVQIEINIKIVEEKQNHQIKKINLSYRDLNFFTEDISWASIDDYLLNTSWDMLLTDVKSDEMYKIIINISLHKTEGLGWEKNQNWKRKHRGQQIMEPKKMYQIRSKNWKQFKNFNKYRRQHIEKRELLLLSRKPQNASTNS